MNTSALLLCIDKFWDEYPTLLENLFEVVPQALEESDLEVELYDVFLHHNSKFCDTLRAQLKEKINDIEVALNMISGSGKLHMATLSALLKLGLGIRLIALTKQGVKEI